ncbi:MAG: cupredoxin domain-containing protein [Gaiellaceae bacterium]
MRTILPAVVAALALAAAGASEAATVTVSIKSSGFSPAALTLSHGDSITWRNVDRIEHQVVANDGSFASPILAPGKSFTFTFNRAGRFPYHDAFKTRLTGTIRVKGPPPSLTFTLSQPIVVYGAELTLSGQVSSQKAGETVSIEAQEYGQPSPVQLATVVTGATGTFGYLTTPRLYTNYVARWGAVASSQLLVQVAPKVSLLPGSKGYMKTAVTAGVSFWHKHVYLQRLSPLGQWVNLAALTLGTHSGRIFRPGAYLPKGLSRIRVFLSVNQAGNGLLSGHSGTQTIRR